MPDIILPGVTPTGTLGASRLPESFDIVMWKGDVLRFTLVLEAKDSNDNVEPIILTGTTPQASISNQPSGETQYEFICTVRDGNKVDFYMPTSVTKNITAGDYIWNFQIVDPNGDARTYLAGDVIVHGEVD